MVPVDEALEFVKDNPDVAMDLLSRIYRGMDGACSAGVVHLMSGPARSRLLYELIIECRRSGKKAKEGSYTLDTSEVDLAACSGLSRETVSREVHKLKEAGLAKVGNKAVSSSKISGPLRRRAGWRTFKPVSFRPEQIE